ncbi:hypothetical protein PCC7424_4942 [Gloeothece citriformis PCC 7424]|uniref:Uncharacterized protein n=1 Tax=Gloeothece citriformis (strain PCC 7424) TaxID=65393 RepID=B7KEH8_GLOC7|nr:hypothetical protein [Gloeothece citriformis]ACK73296.1 hypothetical protein PCC7424_4942 [Gloeothece citriformis PCC 7424]
MNQLTVSSQKLNGRQIDSYLFWLRVKNFLSVGFFSTIVAVFLLITMFYRFSDLDKLTGNQPTTIQPNNTKELTTQKN